MPIVSALTENQLNQHLIARHSRTSGTLTQKRERLQRFLDIEDQKGLRNAAVKKAREIATLSENQTQVTEEYDDAITERLDNLETRLNNAIGEMPSAEFNEAIMMNSRYRIERLEHIIDTLEQRIYALECDAMPPLIDFPDSNPNPLPQFESEMINGC